MDKAGEWLHISWHANYSLLIEILEMHSWQLGNSPFTPSSPFPVRSASNLLTTSTQNQLPRCGAMSCPVMSPTLCWIFSFTCTVDGAQRYPRYHVQLQSINQYNVSNSTVWRTWLFIVYSNERWSYYQFSLPHLCISLKVGRMYFLNLGVKG